MVLLCVGLGLTQVPPGFETHNTIDLAMMVPMFPQNVPTSGFHDTIWANETSFFAAMSWVVLNP